MNDILAAIRAMPATYANLAALITAVECFSNRAALSDFDGIGPVQDSLLDAAHHMESVYAPDRDKIAAEAAEDRRCEDYINRGREERTKDVP